MEKIFTNKKIWEKIAIILVFLILFEFVVSTNVHAVSPMGVLLNPVFGLVTSIGDFGVSVIQKALLNIDMSFHEIDTGWTLSEIWSGIGAGILLVVGTIAGVASGFFTGGAGWVATAVMWGSAIGSIGLSAYVVASRHGFTDKEIPSTVYLPIFSITPQSIFTNSIKLFDVNFFTPRDETETNSTNVENENKDISIVSQIRSNVAKWYIALRNIAIVGMLSILVYIGIRMMLTSIASDKAKYKQLLMDWFVALCLIFIMHYIMAFSTAIVEKVTEAFASLTDREFLDVYNIQNEKVYEYLDKIDKESEEVDFKNVEILEESPNVNWPVFDSMAQARMELQFLDKNGNEEWLRYGYVIVYFALVLLTAYFVYVYLRRVVYMAFLTMIAPLVALTYPIDKAGDGSAQAFNQWLKEYLFNLLIQPMHLVLFTVLIGTAMDLVQTNIVYAMVALFFMVPSEKMVRRFFGFEKAHTPGGLLGGPVAAGAIMNAVSRLGNRGKSQEKLNTSDKEKNNIRTQENLGGDVDATSAIDVENPDSNTPRLASTTLGSTADADSDDMVDTIQTPELTSRMQELDEQEQDLREMAYTDVRDPESLQAWQDLKHEIEEQRKDALLQAYNARTGSLHLSEQTEGRETEEIGISNSEQEQEQARFIAQDRGKVRELAQRNKIGARQLVLPVSKELLKQGYGGARRVGRVLGEKAITGGKTLAKTAIKLPFAATGALVGGIATGALTGDFSKTVQGAIGGATAGMGIASGGMSIASSGSSEAIKIGQEVREAWYGNDEEWERKQQEEKVEKLMKNVALKNAISSKLGEDGLKSMEQSGDLRKYIQNGVQSPEEMIALHNLQEEHHISTEAAIGTWQLHRDIAGGKDTTTMTGRDKVEKAMREKYKRETAGDDEQRAAFLTDTTMKYMDTYSKYLYRN